MPAIHHRVSDIIQEGDIVIAYVHPTEMKSMLVQTGLVLTNRHGSFKHCEMIGKPWGTKLPSTNLKGFIFLLFPTPELWTVVLPHRTQILYMPDISFITSFLELRPGVRMIESGTGSASFSHSIARTIYPTGHLFSFEYHQPRAEKAGLEFKEHGIADIVTISHRDVCKNGFGIENDVTAVFLDLPSPWEALEAAKTAFRNDRIGRICSFSPCVEQVQQTCEALKKLNFTEIKMFEVLVRPYDVRKLPVTAVPKSAADTGKIPKKRLRDDEIPGMSILASKPIEQVKGHTSFLTFATLLPETDSETC